MFKLQQSQWCLRVTIGEQRVKSCVLPDLSQFFHWRISIPFTTSFIINSREQRYRFDFKVSSRKKGVEPARVTSTPFRVIVRSIDISLFNGSTNLLLVRSGPFNSASSTLSSSLRRQKRDNCICYSLHPGHLLDEQIWRKDLRWRGQRWGVIVSSFIIAFQPSCSSYNVSTTFIISDICNNRYI